MNKTALLDQIAADIVQHNICPDLAKQAKHLVPGDGNPDATIVFIGEAPGKKEDEQGVPFIGAAGKFLNEMLATIGLVRQDVYITNIVKYRPPNNRDPQPEEKKAFWPYLVRQLEIIQPNVVVTLGRHSMEYFLPGQKISETHGQPAVATVQSHKWTVLPLYHPAAALYNGGLRQTLLEDFSKLPTIVTNITK